MDGRTVVRGRYPVCIVNTTYVGLLNHRFGLVSLM